MAARPTRGFDSRPPAQRSLMASYGALTRWSKADAAERRAGLDAANAALRSKWEQLADPDGRMSPDDLEAAVARLKKAHYRRMALASAAARAGKRRKPDQAKGAA